MSFKFNSARRHRIPKSRYRVRNWSAYVRRRGDLTLWIDEAALDKWRAPPRNTPSGQAIYSDLAIGGGASWTSASRQHGLKLFGQGEWKEERYGRHRRSWRKLHLAIDADTGEIVANALTENDADDWAKFPVYSSKSTATSPASLRMAHMMASRSARPPRASAVLSTDSVDRQSQRDRHIRMIGEKVRMGWQKATGYGRRSLVETAIGRYKHLIGSTLRARSLAGQRGEVAIAVRALNRMRDVAKPLSVRVT